MTSNRIIDFLRWITKLLTKDEYFPVRREWLNQIAREINDRPQTKIQVLKILRSDGSSLNDAMEVYNSMNGKDKK